MQIGRSRRIATSASACRRQPETFPSPSRRFVALTPRICRSLTLSSGTCQALTSHLILARLHPIGGIGCTRRRCEMDRLARGISLTVVIVVLVGCAGASQDVPTSAQPASPAAPKILNMVGSEPTVIGNFPGVRGGTGGREGIPNEH